MTSDMPDVCQTPDSIVCIEEPKHHPEAEIAAHATRPLPKAMAKIKAESGSSKIAVGCPFAFSECGPACEHRFGAREEPAYRLLEEWGIEIPAESISESRVYKSLLMALGWATATLKEQGVKIPQDMNYPKWEGRRWV